MKFLKLLNKIIIYSFYTFIVFFIVYSTYIINSKEPFDKNFRRQIKSIVKTSSFSKNLFNDYREVYLPNTQFIKVNYKKIDLDFLGINDCYFGKCYTFFLEQHNDNLIVADRKGNIKVTTFSDLDNKIPIFSDIKTNLKVDYILDVLVKDNDIYITGKKNYSENETVLEIFKGKFNKDNINFQSIIKLRSEKCILRHAVHSGKIQFLNDDQNKMLLAINSAGSLDNPSLENLSPDSICGKILLVDLKNKNYEIYSSGHRNIIGLYADENVVLSAEHGPYAGDEINKITKDKKYGWPVASYGEKYLRDKDKSGTQPNYKKNHKKSGFEEPIFSFIPAIGISEIIKLPNNFSKLWEDNFLLASLNGKYLYRIKFSEDYNKIIYNEPIYIGDRIRDLIYNNNSKKIILALELKGSLGIITN